jgi:hypothetical protein
MEVLGADGRLLLLPVTSAIFVLFALLATATVATELRGQPGAVAVVLVWMATYAISFITIFFNVALVHVVVRRWQGEPARGIDGVRAALRRVGVIAGWAILTTTVGLVLRLVERLTLGISRMVLGIAWSVASFFVVPVLAVERRRPVRALRRSGAIVRERWAEGIGGITPIALATIMVVLPLVGLIFIGLVLYVTGLPVPGLLAMTIGASSIVAVWIVSGAVTQVFTLAVFQHATGGPFYEGFPAADLERPRETRSPGGSQGAGSGPSRSKRRLGRR